MAERSGDVTVTINTIAQRSALTSHSCAGASRRPLLCSAYIIRKLVFLSSFRFVLYPAICRYGCHFLRLCQTSCPSCRCCRADPRHGGCRGHSRCHYPSMRDRSTKQVRTLPLYSRRDSYYPTLPPLATWLKDVNISTNL